MSKPLTLLALACAALMAACGGAATNNSNTKTANTNTATPTSTVAATPSESPTASDTTSKYDPAKSPTDAYKAAYAARKNCDVPGMKKLLSKEAIEFMTMMGSDDKKTIDDMVKEICSKPQASTDESRNEKINGDHATLEYLEENGNWKTLDFEKEDGIWKMGFPEKPKKK